MVSSLSQMSKYHGPCLSRSRIQKVHAECLPRRDGIIKVCDEFPGFTHFKTHQPYGADEPKCISVPRSHASHPTDTYPDASEVSIRKAVARFLPGLKDRPFINRAMCWCTDTADSNLLICEHPKWKNLILATGDSGYVYSEIVVLPEK
jgi:sarcosine oxidase/L-pipecolate oxidase